MSEWPNILAIPSTLPSQPFGHIRNGKSRKTLKGGCGELLVEVSVTVRARSNSLIDKYQVRWTGDDGKILSLYVWGIAVRGI